ncbi:hypothetical protein KC963_02245, partial [Candidatus Saccharibacteria bacterium]|nr:hypothetical protein [Candidatus Saccharibacteria bacterium]
DEEKKAKRERSGKISGGKLGKPTLWAVLDLIGVPDKFDPYVLGKFQRGNDVEDRAIQFLTGIKPWEVEPGAVIKSDPKAILTGEFVLQKEGSYRGGVGYIDLSQKVGDAWVYHEIKSSTKMAYDKVSSSGRYRGVVDVQKGVGVPYLHHALQLAYYCIGDDVTRGFLHYFNADDYRLCTFAINPLDYKEEIDKEIDDIQLCFVTKQLPAFEGFLPWHKVKGYWSYAEWNELSPQQMMDKLKSEFPEQYKKFMEMEI